MKIILIVLGIIVGVGLLIYLVRKLLPILITLAVFAVVGLGIFHYYGISLNDIYGYKQISSAVKSLEGDFNYDRENRLFSVEGKEYGLTVQKFDGGTEIKGQSSVINEQGTQVMLNLFSIAANTFSADEIKNIDVKSIDNNDVASVLSSGVDGVLSNPDNYKNLVNDLQKSGEALEVGKFKMYVKDEKLFMEKVK